MQTDWIICCAVLLAVVILTYALEVTRLKKAFQQWMARWETLPPYDRNSRTSPSGLADDMERCFADRRINKATEERFTAHYTPLFRQAVSLCKRAERVGFRPPQPLLNALDEWMRLPDIVTRHNERITTSLLATHKEFFDHCLTYPLDEQQRRSILSEEENCLVVSSAGSGKTSSIVGKVKYLTEIRHVPADKILLISYTRKAANELSERIGTVGLQGFTFHKLAIDIIGKASGKKPSVCDNTDALIVSLYRRMTQEKDFCRKVVKYFIDYSQRCTATEKAEEQARQQLAEEKKVRLKALLPDMDGNAIYVRSKQEQTLCFILSGLGVRFRYEEPYKYPLADETHVQYRPDFSIHFIKDGQPRRIYLELFGINEHEEVPLWFAKDKGITLEEANRQYNDGIAWKRAAHEKFGTTLLEITSADFRYNDVRSKVKAKLQAAGVPLHEKTDEELYQAILPEGSKREKIFIRLAATFIALLKSNCRTINEVLADARSKNDERSIFVVAGIMKPLYERYTAELRQRGEMDFTDLISEATRLVRECRPVGYEHIIVDEFQDISVDRYRFLQALREGMPPARLYCVGDDWQSIYRFSGSDIALFNDFSRYFGHTDVCRIETTYRFGEPLVGLSSRFIQRNSIQLTKDIHPFNHNLCTDLTFCPYNAADYLRVFEQAVASVPAGQSVYLLGRYSFDDIHLSRAYRSVKEGEHFYYLVSGRRLEFLTVHRSKGLEADYVILLQCNKGAFGFPSNVSDDAVLNLVLTESDAFPYGEERRLFYVAITRAKKRTIVLYDNRQPSVFVTEFLHPETLTEESYAKHRNANKRWSRKADSYLLMLHEQGRSLQYISEKMGRSQTSIAMRLKKLKKA